MEKKIIFWGLMLLLCSCNTTPRDRGLPKETNESKIAIQSERSETDNSSEEIWKYSFNPQKEAFEIIQMRTVDDDTLTGETIEKIINKSWPKVQIKFTGTSHDTAFVSIPQSEVLTQQMGSSGAESFMVTTTWSFTELKGIRYVAFDFAYGDHAMPGVYSRKSWKFNNIAE